MGPKFEGKKCEGVIENGGSYDDEDQVGMYNHKLTPEMNSVVLYRTQGFFDWGYRVLRITTPVGPSAWVQRHSVRSKGSASLQGFSCHRLSALQCR